MRKLKVFGHPWHLAHQYELSKLPFLEWSWLRQYKRDYNTSTRGDFMTNWVDYYEPGKYDFALLHVDQQCLAGPIREIGKGRLYKELSEVITDIPKILLMHGTPFYPELFQDDAESTGDVKQIKALGEIIGDNYLIVNSETARLQWLYGLDGAKKIQSGEADAGEPIALKPEKVLTIIHGLDANEWFDLPKEPRVVTMIGPAGLDRYYDRDLLEAVREGLDDLGIKHVHITVDWRSKNWDDYRDFIGRSLIYFNPTREAPMPRSRTEALLSGCCVITTLGQDADSYFKNGENSFTFPKHCEPAPIVELIDKLIKRPDIAVQIGAEGKKMAIEKFSVERYQNDWKCALEKILKTTL